MASAVHRHSHTPARIRSRPGGHGRALRAPGQARKVPRPRLPRLAPTGRRWRSPHRRVGCRRKRRLRLPPRLHLRRQLRHCRHRFHQEHSVCEGEGVHRGGVHGGIRGDSWKPFHLVVPPGCFPSMIHCESQRRNMRIMAKEVLNRFPDIASIQLRMPNLHFLPVNLSSKENSGLVKFADDVYMPTDEPHGTIEAMLSRAKSKL